MKFSRQMIMIIAFVLFLFFALGLSSATVSPYHPDNLFKRDFVYEPFTQLTPAVFVNNPPPTPPSKDSKKKVEGFEGLMSSPYGEEKPLDIYSTAKGDLTCQSVGMYNSKGPLCLDENQKKMLQTRGANATGRPFEIGH